MTIAYSSLLEYDMLLGRARELWESYQAPEVQDVEPHLPSEDERMASSDEEVLFANEEEDRALRAS
eukprot:274464-Amphidinium_carterae.1